MACYLDTAKSETRKACFIHYLLHGLGLLTDPVRDSEMKIFIQESLDVSVG